jgi:hypothetical protein
LYEVYSASTHHVAILKDSCERFWITKIENTPEMTDGCWWPNNNGAVAPSDMAILDLLKAIAEDFGQKDLKDKLVQNLVVPNGVRTVRDLRHVCRTEITEAIKECGLRYGFQKYLQNCIFEVGEGWELSPEFGDGQAIESQLETQGQQDPLYSAKVKLTTIFNGMRSALRWNFTPRATTLLIHTLCGGKVQMSDAVSIVFLFWAIAFKTLYICCIGKKRVAAIFNNINSDLKTQKVIAALEDGFSNRRQGRMKSLPLHAADHRRLDPELLEEMLRNGINIIVV